MGSFMGAVDSAPKSIASTAPKFEIFATKSSDEEISPPSEKELGVQFSTPIRLKKLF
jgi:hypothetical protein